MSRTLRIEWSHVLYHVTARRDRSEPIVEDDNDREDWVALLAQTRERCAWRLHAWWRMGNHCHLLLVTPDATLSNGMRNLGGVSPQHPNRLHGRVGCVFQGRFKAIFLERQSDLFELARYIVLDPACTGSVALPEQWSRRTFHDTASPNDSPSRCTLCNSVWPLAHFAERRSQSAARYIDLVRTDIGKPNIWNDLKAQTFRGGDASVVQVQSRIADEALRRDLPHAQKRPANPVLAPWVSQSPASEAMARAFASDQHRLQEVANHFGVSQSTVSRAARAWRGAAEAVL